VIRAAIIIALTVTAAHADDNQTIYHCNGMLTSNGTCIGSESNVNSVGNHEPIYGDTFYTKPEPWQRRDDDRERRQPTQEGPTR